MLFAAFLLPCLETWLYISSGRKSQAHVITTAPSLSINGEPIVVLDADSGLHQNETEPLLGSHCFDTMIGV